MQKQNQKNQGKKKKKNRKVEVSKSARIKIQKVYTCSLCPLGPCRQILASRLHFSYLRYFETNWTVLYHLLSLQQLLPSALRLPAPSIMWSSLSPSAWAASSQLHAANFVLATSQSFFSLLGCPPEKDKSSPFTVRSISPSHSSLLKNRESSYKERKKNINPKTLSPRTNVF